MGEVFDFVVVGAGSAGCVLAERLSANGRHSVAVIEAGGTDRRFWVQTPLGYGKIFYDRSLNWSYQAEPDPGLAGRSDYWPRGKVLGGSSSINAMVWVRGAAEDRSRRHRRARRRHQRHHRRHRNRGARHAGDAAGGVGGAAKVGSLAAARGMNEISGEVRCIASPFIVRRRCGRR